MFRILTIVLLLILSINDIISQDAGAYYYTGPPATVVFIRKDNDGDIVWRQHTQYDSITTTNSTSTIHYNSTFYKKNMKVMYPKMPLKALIKDGKTYINISASVASIIRSATKDMFEISYEGNDLIIPHAIKPGDTIDDSKSQITMAGMTLNVDMTNIVAVKYETITTNAGEFDCIVIKMNKSEKGLTRNRVNYSYTWYARGIGMVRHDTYSPKDKLMSIEIIESITI